MKKPINLTPILYLVVLILIFTLVIGYFMGKTDSMTYSELITQFEKENVRSFVVEDNTITLRLYNEVDGKKDIKAKW